jgi:hypothetical protein
LNSKHPIYCPPNKLAEVVRAIAEGLAQVSYFMSPRVVKHIAGANAEWRDSFAHGAKLGGYESPYFYDGSACAFPGIRRMAEKSERAMRPQKYHASFKCILDVNWFPREIWSFICTGKRYTASNWAQSGLGNFELAHLIPHKPSETKQVRDFFDKVPGNLDGKYPLGLYTCVANTVLLPKGAARPTDGMSVIRAAFLARYRDLYGAARMGGFKGFRLPETISWYRELPWNEPWEPENWKARAEAFDKFRRNRLDTLINGDS